MSHYVLFTLFVFVCILWCTTYIVLCIYLFFFSSCVPLLVNSLDCSFLIALWYSLTFIKVWFMLIIGDPIATVKCRTATKALFLCFNLCLNVTVTRSFLLINRIAIGWMSLEKIIALWSFFYFISYIKCQNISLTIKIQSSRCMFCLVRTQVTFAPSKKRYESNNVIQSTIMLSTSHQVIFVNRLRTGDILWMVLYIRNSLFSA